MDDLQGRLDEKIRDIEKFAAENNNMVSYETFIDILKDKNDSVSENDVIEALRGLRFHGIAVTDEEEGYGTDEQNSAAFIPADVKIGQSSINVYNLMERLENNEIDLKPGYQRKENLWSKEAQSRLIESLMLKIPLPAFYFDASIEERWRVIDGLQRLSAFSNYLVGVTTKNGFEKWKLKGLQYLQEFNDKTFDELPRQYQRRIKESAIIAYTVEKGTPDMLVYNIFQRINTGGLPLSDQEIRQALYSGKATELIGCLADSEEFKYVTQRAVRTDRMADREYVLRYLAYTQLDYHKEYNENLNSFLIKALKVVNAYPTAKLEKIEDRFKLIMTICYDIFGRYAFRKYTIGGRRGPINKAIFELWAICFYPLDHSQLKQLVEQKECILVRFQSLLQNQEFISALKSGDIYSISKRVTMTKKIIEEILC